MSNQYPYPLDEDNPDLAYTLDTCPYCGQRTDTAAPPDCPDDGGHHQ